MNILFASNGYPPEIGGIPRSVATTAEALRNHGHRVVVLAPTHNLAQDELDVVRIPAVTFKEFSLPLLLLDRDPLLLRLGLFLAGFRPDVVHVHQPHLLGNTGQRIARRFQVPCVFTWHTQYDQHAQRILPGQESAAGAMFVAVSFANACSAIVAPSTAIQQQLRRWRLRPATTVIPTGINTSFFATGNRQRGRSRWGLSQDAFVAGTVSRLSPEKNLEVLAQVLREVGASTLIVGDGPSRGSFASALPGATFTGGLTGQDLLDAYAALDVFVFTSQSETQGMVCAEALAAGVPVYALSAPGVDDAVTSACGYLAGTPEELVRALRSVTPELLSRQRAAAFQRARAFDIRVTSAQLSQLYATYSKLGALRKARSC